MALTLEAFAGIRALLDAGEDRVKVLAASHLDDASWAHEGERFLADLADAAERGELAPLRVYQAAYQARWRAAVGSTPAAGPPAAGDVRRDVDIPRGAKPSLTSPKLDSASIAAADSTPKTKPIGAETGHLDMSAIRAALPFLKAPPATATSSVAARVVVQSEPLVPESTPARAKVDATPAAAVSSKMQKSPFGAETGHLDMSAIRAALPFLNAAAPKDAPATAHVAPREAEPTKLDGAIAAQVPAPRPRNPLAQTELGGALPLPPAAAVPFRSQVAAKTGCPLALERFAEVSAALRQDPDLARALARFGVSQADWSTSARSYAAQFAGDPAVKARFDELVRKAMLP